MELQRAAPVGSVLVWFPSYTYALICRSVNVIILLKTHLFLVERLVDVLYLAFVAETCRDIGLAWVYDV